MKNLFYFSCIFILFSGCKKETPTPTPSNTTKITGNVVNFDTKKPIENAEIGIFIPFSVTIDDKKFTDKNGNFVAKINQTENIFIKIRKKNFLVIQEDKYILNAFFEEPKQENPVSGEKFIKTEYHVEMLPSGFIYFNTTSLDKSKLYEIEAEYNLNNEIYIQKVLFGSKIANNGADILNAEVVADKPSLIRWRIKGANDWNKVPFIVKTDEAIDVVLK